MPTPPVFLPLDAPGSLGPGARGPAPDDRLAALRASVSARLRRVCRGWDAADFDALVECVARTKLRWDDQEHGGA